MKEYYVFLNGQEGPFTFDQLRTKNLTADTPAWYNGLAEWTTVGKIPELSSLVKVAPPPFMKAVPPPFEIAAASDYEYELEMQEFFAERKKTDWGTIFLVSFAIGCFVLLLWFMNK